ncbi:MAG: 4Fe-4S dicluster domain-containing protein [Parasporobacterium sp.]|nr:4Fe-4S dicluster domain-containing protein [Parasporobacterium sp.]
MRWGMVIDLKRCNGCGACTIACKQANYVPPKVFRTKMAVGETGVYPNAKKFIYPTQCNQCSNPVCVTNCPTGATFRREDGIVDVDVNKCTGCQQCILLCPYHERMCNYGEQKEYYPGQGLTPYEVLGKEMKSYPDGTIVKCVFCKELIDEGLAKGLKPGIDREATPACVLTCMCRARYFGDLDDPESNVSKLLRERNYHVLNAEYGTEPRVYYLD